MKSISAIHLAITENRGGLHSKKVVDDFRNLFGNVQKFGNNIEIWKLEIRSKQNLIGFAAPAIFLYDGDFQELVILL